MMTDMIPWHNQNQQPTPLAIQRPQEPMIKDPETFTGQRDSPHFFITKCKLVFELQPSRFGNDQTKVSYTISLLRGTPLLAVQPLLSFDSQSVFLNNHRLFIQYLQTNYGDPNEKGTARKKTQEPETNWPSFSVLCQISTVHRPT